MTIAKLRAATVRPASATQLVEVFTADGKRLEVKSLEVGDKKFVIVVGPANQQTETTTEPKS